MNQDELKALIRRGESETAEFKENFDKKAIETVVAFSNTKGGVILVGVSDESRVLGVQIGRDSVNEWVNQISQSTESRIIPDVETTRLDGKDVVVIYVKEFPIKPVSMKGRCFRRVKDMNRVMAPQEVAQMHLSTIGMSLDSLPLKNTAFSDLDLEKVRQYITKANATGRRNISGGGKPSDVLEKLELVEDGKPTLAAVLLFGRSPQEKVSQATVHCGRFRQETVIVDDRMIGGTAVEQIESVMDFIRKNTNVRFVISGKPTRDEIWDYPLEALREAVVNAICHRDYADNSDIQLKIHDDRLTIWNPGGLMPGMTIDELYNPNHSSKLRNKLIAQIFYDLELIERYGSGIQRILDACGKAGLPKPVFEEMSGGFLVVFRKDAYTNEYLQGLGLNERQVKAVMHTKEKGKITNTEYQELNQVSKSTATRDLEELVENKVIEQIGITGKGTEYVLKGVKGVRKGSERGQTAHNGD